jgi:hypothetical protein
VTRHGPSTARTAANGSASPPLDFAAIHTALEPQVWVGYQGGVRLLVGHLGVVGGRGGGRRVAQGRGVLVDMWLHADLFVGA